MRSVSQLNSSEYRILATASLQGKHTIRFLWKPKTSFLWKQRTSEKKSFPSALTAFVLTCLCQRLEREYQRVFNPSECDLQRKGVKKNKVRGKKKLKNRQGGFSLRLLGLIQQTPYSVKHSPGIHGTFHREWCEDPLPSCVLEGRNTLGSGY